jgi:shikimate dehydrogenase
MYHLGIVGYPLGHSLSPAIHEEALAVLGLDGSYKLYEIPLNENTEQNFGKLVQLMRAGEIHGLNITIPYKQKIMPLVDTLTPEAKSIGAVNTIYLENHQIIGTNTDAPAFTKELTGAGVTANGKAIILGAGGGAYAVAASLLLLGWELTIAARRLTQAHTMQKWFLTQNNHYKIHTITLSHNELEPLLHTTDLIVNTTPVGMKPDFDDCPWPIELPLPRSAFIYDLIYNPPMTVFLKLAEEHQVSFRGGAGMLIEQAALAFELWTGREAPRQSMADTLLKNWREK